MKGYLLNWRMTLRRRMACLLVVLSAAAVTLFLLIYPRFVERTRAELDFAYDSIPVTGWLVNTQEYADPVLYGQIWHQMLDTGLIGEHNSYATLQAKVYEKELLLSRAKATGAAALINALTALMEEEKASSRYDRLDLDAARAVNRLDAEQGLRLLREKIRWAEGLDERCLTGDGNYCLLPESLGWEPGETVPIYLASYDVGKHIACMTVAGVYAGTLPNHVVVVLPLKAAEILSETHWLFYVNACNFTVSDNKKLPELKEQLMELGLNGASDLAVRVAIDDRILESTVSPIQSNLALLEGLYRFFFVLVAGIGFFLCFLLVRGRKTEFAVMRMLGESRFQVTLKVLLEQAALCLLGILLGGALLVLAGQGAPDMVSCCTILGCYTLGAALAVLFTVRVDVMEILRDKE